MIHALVLQLRFTRSEFKRGLDALSDVDARQRIAPMNCISWNIGHLAWQEQRYWLQRLQGETLLPELDTLFCYGCPPATPPLDEMWQAWHTIIAAADPFLDTLTAADLLQARTFEIDSASFTTNAGNLMQRVIYHYWYHNGENQAIRQLLRHEGLQDFVGNIDAEAPFKG
jgi:hypothetical protein